MSENGKREKKKNKRNKDAEKTEEKVEVNTEPAKKQKKIKKPKTTTNPENIPTEDAEKTEEKIEVNTEPEKKQKKIKKPKTTTNPENIPTEDAPETTKTKKNKKRQTVVQFTPETIDNEVVETNESPSKRKKTEETRLPTEEELQEVQKPENIKDVGSKRQQKRLKHEKLLADNKLKQDTVLQEKALNYLSRWKHNRSEWKFEKLRQVWLQNHMFDSSNLPDKFFDTLVEYFGGSKGKIREVLIDTCMKIVDDAEGNEEAGNDAKFKRARTLLQFLQE